MSDPSEAAHLDEPAHPRAVHAEPPRAVLALIAGVVFLAVVSGTMLNVALPLIGAAFRVGEATYSWIATGYTLTFAIFSAIQGSLSDSFGLKRLYRIGILSLGVTSIFVALAPGIGWVIAIRLLQGAGAAALPALGSTIIGRVYPPHRRGAALGVVMGTVGIAASIGPFLGGVLLEAFGWRAVFLATSLVLVAWPVAGRVLPASLDDTTPRRFDLPGAVLLGLAVGTLLYSTNVLDTHGPGAAFVLTLAGGAALLGAFVVWIRRTETPFVRPGLFADIRFAAACAAAFLANAVRFGAVLLAPIFLIRNDGLTPIQVGLVLLPGALLMGFTSPLSGRLADRFGARVPVMIGGLLMLVAGIVLVRFTGVSAAGITAGMAISGLGYAFLQSPLTSAATLVLPRSEAGVGMGFYMMVVFLGGAFGVAIGVSALPFTRGTELSWIGWSHGTSAAFANAGLVLTSLTLLLLALVPLLPVRSATARPIAGQ